LWTKICNFVDHKKIFIIGILENNCKEIKTYDSTVIVNTAFGQRFLDYLGPDCFNSIDLEQKKVCSRSYNSTKQCVNKWLLRNLEW